MKPPLFVRPLSTKEHRTLQQGLRSGEAFALRRCQILLASERRQAPARIAQALGGAVPTVRNAIRAFHAEGFACLREESSRPKAAKPLREATGPVRLRDLLHRSPRDFGKPTSIWPPALAAEVAYQQGLTPRRLSTQAIRPALRRLGVRWRRAKRRITGPDPQDAPKKRWRDRLIGRAASHPDWVLGFQDETWWSRLARPDLHAWAGGEPLRVGQLEAAKDEPEAQALCCYGLLRGDTGGLVVRFVAGRPVRPVTEDYLGWIGVRLAEEGKGALLLVWDDASWHVSQRVRAWIQAHTRQAKRTGGVRIVACGLPIKSPWLNPIEPCWIHGKRSILEPDRKPTAAEVIERVCEYYECEHFEHLTQKVA